MTLAGLALAIGPLVDSAIICLENTERHLSQGEPVRKAARGSERGGHAGVGGQLQHVVGAGAAGSDAQSRTLSYSGPWPSPSPSPWSRPTSCRARSSLARGHLAQGTRQEERQPDRESKRRERASGESARAGGERPNTGGAPRGRPERAAKHSRKRRPAAETIERRSETTASRTRTAMRRTGEKRPDRTGVRRVQNGSSRHRVVRSPSEWVMNHRLLVVLTAVVVLLVMIAASGRS